MVQYGRNGAVADPTWVVNNSNKIWCSIAGMEAVADPTCLVNNSNNIWTSIAGMVVAAGPT